MTSKFQKATKRKSRLRMAIIGPAGSGKTFTALLLATSLGKRVAVIDTERGSASKYADLFPFDVLELETFHPRTYVESIQEAAAAGYDVIVVDSLSHAWVGKEGGLELHDKEVDRQKVKNSFTAWREVTTHQNAMVDSIMQSPAHVIATIRSKMEYLQEKDDKGRSTVRKVGMAPVQRDGLEYEFDVVGDIDQEHTLVVTKTRCPALSGQVIRKPGKELADTLRKWLSDGAEAPIPVPLPREPLDPSEVIGDAELLELVTLFTQAGGKDLANYIHNATKGRTNDHRQLWVREYQRVKKDLTKRIRYQSLTPEPVPAGVDREPGVEPEE